MVNYDLEEILKKIILDVLNKKLKTNLITRSTYLDCKDDKKNKLIQELILALRKFLDYDLIFSENVKLKKENEIMHFEVAKTINYIKSLELQNEELEKSNQSFMNKRIEPLREENNKYLIPKTHSIKPIRKIDTWKNIINKHLAVLSKKYKILYSKDDYGIIKKDKWYKEVKYFLDAVNLNINNEDEFDDFIEILHNEINIYNDSIKSENDELEFDKNMSPNDYEYYCKDILTNQGIDARVTKQSGDQGVDVIVYNKNNEVTVVIQCKLYSSAVGNKAVQEVYAAKQHFGAKFAMVVTNNTYTKSAIELSNTTGVKLLHHEDLKNFSEILDIKL